MQVPGYKKTFRLLALLLVFCTCKKPYMPEVIQQENQYLVVNGVINIAPGGKTHLRLSRTRNLEDTTINHPEPGASVTIEGADGSRYFLQELTSDGDYQSDPLQLSSATPYRVSIQTRQGKHYNSEFVRPVVTPPIDSVSWQQPGDLQLYVSTHDPSEQAKFFRWDFEETWEYHAQLETVWLIQADTIAIATPDNQKTICWRGQFSKQIILANAAALSEARISLQPILLIPNGDERLAWRYSILVNQYALSSEAYNYWQIVEKNSQELGGLFDQMPSNLIGNFSCQESPEEPVLGYMSATAVQSARIFISRLDLQNWPQTLPRDECELVGIGYDNRNFPRWDYPDTSYAVYYFVTGGANLAKNSCLDCRRAGGTNVKPSFWR